MPSWRDDKILELANQLTYSPADKRREQLCAAIALMPALDPAKTYPWDFVHFRITSFQPRAHIDHIVSGKILRADLASLIEFLSDTLSIKVEDAAATGDTVLEFDDVSKKFNVSSKTIQRWRKQGLIALRYLHPDGRRRLGFLESDITRFAADNKEKVDRSAGFTQLSDDERAAVILMARNLSAAPGAPLCIKDISRLIGKKLNRSPETIRYTIRKYDRDHPEAAIFPDTDSAPLPRRAKPAPTPLFEEFAHSLNQDHTATPATVPTATDAQDALRDRAQQLKLQEIEFIPNPLFDHPDAGNIILNVLPAEAIAKAQATVSAGINAKSTDPYVARIPRDLPAFLADIFRQPVMPLELELDAFRRMNYLKFLAAKNRQSLDANAATSDQLTHIDSLLEQANELKNAIIQANLRVVVHVARKHQRPGRPLMELVSDGTIWLMRAIERFDFARNTRFTTYAGYVIMKNFARGRSEQLTLLDGTMLTGQEEIITSLNDHAAQPIAEQIDQHNLKIDLRQVIQDLPSREKELLSQHYGLDESQPALSLSQIGDKMGLTKTRVRQLEARALRRLRLLMEARREKIRSATAKQNR
jgi:RNA polymerase sigma factor (sigma-70 family)